MSGKSLFIFRRDLRIADNTGLNRALSESGEVSACFCLDNRQLKNNPYFGPRAYSFMLRSLAELASELETAGGRIGIFRGTPEELIGKHPGRIGAVYFNSDYTPFSRKRDGAIRAICDRRKIRLVETHDALLHAPGEVLTDMGKPYTVFTPFKRKAKRLAVRKIEKLAKGNFSDAQFGNGASEISELRDAGKHAGRGGRREALSLLKRACGLSDYTKNRDFPALGRTTGLSAHNKFGTLSIREVYHALEGSLGPDCTLMDELYWRDFFTHVAYFFPKVFEGPFRGEYARIRWSGSRAHFNAWRDGKTGFPIVDAGMRELEESGRMHNRVRMIVSSFLVKDLHVDWRLGERHFAQKLEDYDPAVNNGNWQWAASTGCDAAPYFRIFNPWRQQERFDPDCEYIKKWVPELSNLSSGKIHAIASARLREIKYPPPIVIHEKEAKRSIADYRAALGRGQSLRTDFVRIWKLRSNLQIQ